MGTIRTAVALGLGWACAACGAYGSAPNGGGATVEAASEAAYASGGEVASADAVPAEAPSVHTGATPASSTATDSQIQQVLQEQEQPARALLTAASVGDADRRGPYLDFLTRHPWEARALDLDMARRTRIRVVDQHGRPVNDARVEIAGLGPNATGIHGRTHADGTWDYFPSVSHPGAFGRASLTVTSGQNTVRAILDVPSQGDGQDLVVRLPGTTALAPSALDLGFLIDVTGSMEDELRYVNAEIGEIVQRIQATAPETRIRVGATFYRDRTDRVVVQQIPFSADVTGFAAAMRGVRASGGGDYPEDMNAGLEAALGRMAWTQGNAARVLVIISDAPPQRYADSQFTYHHAMALASENGIRILPVAASGADRTVEYLFRAMGAFTSTPYVYLTDDSGLGNSHLEADTDRVGVEYFSDLLSRMIVSDLSGRGMHEPGTLGSES